MPASGKRRGSNLVPRLCQGINRCGVGSGPGHGSWIGLIHPEKALRKINCEVFDLIHKVVSLVITVVRQSFRIPEPEIRQQHFHGQRAHDVFRRYQWYALLKEFIVIHRQLPYL
jgi:hypothetical protein